MPSAAWLSSLWKARLVNVSREFSESELEELEQDEVSSSELL